MKNSSYSYLLERNQIFKKERRINKRHRYNSKFKVMTANSEKLDLEVQGVDISLSGIGFISNTQFQINDMLEVIFKYNQISIPVAVKVAHVNLYDQGYFIGGQFIAIQNVYREILKQDLL